MYGEPTWANGALYLGDGTGGMYELVPNPLGPQPDFDLEIDRLLAQGNAGSTMNFTATVIPKNGFAGSVSLSVTKIPSRATMALTPSVVGPSPAPYTSTVAIATSDFGAIYDLAVISATGGGRTRSAGMWLQIGDFALSGTAVQVPQGGSGTSTVRVAPSNGFDGPVTFTIGALPEGTTASFSPASATDHATLTFETSPSTPPGIYTVQVTGRSGTLTRTCTVALTVNQFADFKVELKEPSRQAPAGATAVYEVIVAASASFSGQITFSTNGLPPGATASFAPGAAPGVEVLTVTLAPDTASGPWTFSVVAAGGGLTRTVPAQLQVLPATGFDLTAPPSMRVAQGGAASFNVAITPHNGFADAVALAVDGLPAGVTASFSPLDSSGHSILTVSASTSATPGVHSASVKATGGGYTRTSPFSIEVVAASAGGGCTSGGSVGFAPALLSLLLAGRMRRRRSGRAAVG
jgi:hypothetical protein